MPTFEQARIADGITRAETAKMISVYAEKFLAKQGDSKKFVACASFTDRNEVNVELQGYMTTACTLGLMGYYANGKTVQQAFHPNDAITRAEV
jgi:hypothetical protein